MKPDAKELEELVRRIVTKVSPLRIILFGSAARGEMGPHSDVDVLVVVSDGSNCREIARTLYRQLRGLHFAKDILVVQRRDVEQYRDNPYLVIHTALSQGKELYHVAS